jgi:hypothetical protein
MIKPNPDEAEVPLEYPDKVCIGTFEQMAHFDAHLDEAENLLSLHRIGSVDHPSTEAIRPAKENDMDWNAIFFAVSLPVFIFGVIGLGVYVHRVPG